MNTTRFIAKFADAIAELTRDGEEWRPIPGYERTYCVSSEGRIWSCPRPTTRGGLMRQRANKGYRIVTLTQDGIERRWKVHQLILLAFVGERPAGAITRHLDGNPTNNHLENLAYGTQVENALDMVRHGRHHLRNQTECRRGHPFDEKNTAISADGRHRRCRECTRIRERARHA